MATSVHLPPDLTAFAQASVRSGRYSNVSEVVSAALRLLQEGEMRRAAFVASLEQAVAEGDRDGFVSAEELVDSLRKEMEAESAATG